MNCALQRCIARSWAHSPKNPVPPVFYPGQAHRALARGGVDLAGPPGYRPSRLVVCVSMLRVKVRGDVAVPSGSVDNLVSVQALALGVPVALSGPAPAPCVRAPPHGLSPTHCMCGAVPLQRRRLQPGIQRRTGWRRGHRESPVEGGSAQRAGGSGGECGPRAHDVPCVILAGSRIIPGGRVCPFPRSCKRCKVTLASFACWAWRRTPSPGSSSWKDVIWICRSY